MSVQTKATESANVRLFLSGDKVLVIVVEKLEQFLRVCQKIARHNDGRPFLVLRVC